MALNYLSMSEKLFNPHPSENWGKTTKNNHQRSKDSLDSLDSLGILLSQYLQKTHQEAEQGNIIDLARKLEGKIGSLREKLIQEGNSDEKIIKKIKEYPRVRRIKKQIIYREIPLVIKIAKGHKSKNKNVDMEDLIQAGIVGLVESINNWIKKSAKGEKTNLAGNYLEGKIRSEIRDKLSSYKLGRLQISKKLMLSKIPEYNQAKGKLSEKLGREPTLEEIAQELGWNERKIKRIISAILTQRGYISLDAPIEPSGISAKNIIPDPNAISVEETVILADLKEKLLKMMKEDLFTEKQKEVLEGILAGKRTTEIAEEMGVSSQVISTHKRNIIASIIKNSISKKIK